METVDFIEMKENFLKHISCQRMRNDVRQVILCPVVRASAPGAVDLCLIPSRVKQSL